MATRYTRLHLKVSDKVDISLIRYDVTVIYKSLSAKPTSNKPYPLGVNKTFDDKGYSKIHNLSNRGIEEIRYYIKDSKGELLKEVTAKPFSKKGLISAYTFKTTKASVMKDSNNNKIVGVDNTEVAWYLVKKRESVESFLSRIYRYTPTSREENIFRANNPHLVGNPVLVLQPGDVVVLSNTSTENGELKRVKSEARSAKNKIEELKKDPSFDSVMFANNLDALNSIYTSSEFVAATNVPVKADFNGTTVASTLYQGNIHFNEAVNKRVTSNYKSLVEAMELERANKTKLANPKHFSQFKKKYSGLFRDFDNAWSMSFFREETGVKTTKLRSILKQDVYARSPSANGGIKGMFENYKSLGKVTKYTKFGGNLLVAVSVADAGINIKQAYDTGDKSYGHKTAIKETFKVGGSITGGTLGAAAGTALAVLVLGVGTGGVGLVVIGVAAAIGGGATGYAGTLLGEEFGEFLGDIIID